MHSVLVPKKLLPRSRFRSNSVVFNNEFEIDSDKYLKFLGEFPNLFILKYKFNYYNLVNLLKAFLKYSIFLEF